MTANMSGIRTIVDWLDDNGISVTTVESKIPELVYVPRASFKENALSKYSNKNQYALYFLIGYNSNDQLQVYVGQTTTGIDRLIDHNKNKDWWSEALFIFTKWRYFDETKLKYLEGLAHEQLKEVGRCVLENGQIPSKSNVEIPVQNELNELMNVIHILIKAQGYSIFDVLDIPQQSSSATIIVPRKKPIPHKKTKRTPPTIPVTLADCRRAGLESQAANPTDKGAYSREYKALWRHTPEGKAWEAADKERRRQKNVEKTNE